MAQDTRKDPRAKVLTMTVRYKSATVDEFIEHHSHDVSRGGIFIKTPSPFLPGTLLKFEIRIADDKPMLQGVGRVVWKREPAGAGPDKPAGMGVKFIKVDEASRALIDRLVTSKGASASAYDAEAPMDLAATAAAPPPAPAVRAAPNPAPVGAAPARPAGVGPVGPAVRKATMIGLGINAASAANAAASSGPASARPKSVAPRPAEPMFPKTNSEADMPPPEERTVMKQAAQLLEEALKGAGGSIDEVGSAPLTLDSPRDKPAREPLRHEPHDDDNDLTVPYDRAAAKARDEASAPPPSSRRGESPPISLDRRASAPVKEPSPPLSVRPARSVPAAPVVEPPKKKSSFGRATLSLLLVALAAGAAYVALQKKGPEPVPETPAAVATIPPPAPTPVVSAAPIAPVEIPSAAAVASVVAPMISASTVSPVPPAGKPAVLAPVKKSGPIEKAAPIEEPAPVEKAAPPEKPAPVEKPAPPEKPAPVVAAPRPKPAPKPPSEEGATPPPEKKKPAPKPADDNPY